MQGSLAKPFDFSAPPGEFARLHVEPFWKRRMVELSALCRIVDLECPELSSSADLTNVSRWLAASRTGGMPVLRSPAFLLWINIARYFVMRNIHQSLPMGHVRDHFHDLRRFAVAAACADGDCCEASLRIQQDGRLSIPGIDRVLCVGRQHAGKVLSLKTDSRTLTAGLDDEQFAVRVRGKIDRLEYLKGNRGWSEPPRLGWGILLDDSVEMYDAHRSNNPDWRMRRIDPEYVSCWARSCEEACRLVSLIEASLWTPVRAVVGSILPLEAPPDKNLSGTSDHVLGCVCTSLPTSTPLLAETLVHEAAHTTLHILSDEVNYWESLHAVPVYRSPWRADLRPISGMVHGVFAFLAVADFWALSLQNGGSEDFQQLGRHRLRTVAMQLQEALGEIAGAPELTAAGRDLLSKAERKLEKLSEVSRLYGPSVSVERAIGESLRGYRDGLPQVPHDSLRAPVPRVDREWSRELGITMPPPINHTAARVVCRESISRAIHLAAARRDAVVSRWAALLDATGDCEPESAAFVQGSICYGQGDFLGAVTSYAAYVERRWEDVDAWRLLSSALRRAGKSQDALFIVFNLHELQQCKPDEIRAELGPQWFFHLDELATVRPGAPSYAV